MKRKEILDFVDAATVYNGDIIVIYLNKVEMSREDEHTLYKEMSMIFEEAFSTHTIVIIPNFMQVAAKGRDEVIEELKHVIHLLETNTIND